MANNKENIQGLISLGLAVVLMSAILWLLGKVIRPEQSEQITATNSSLFLPYTNSPFKDKMSLGERIFVTKDSSPDKEAGRKAFEAGDFATAISKFQLSLQSKRNDPETLIYLNNAKIGKSKVFKVAVSVPIGIILNEAEETLRGLAQAQDEVNSSGGIYGVPLQLQIAKIDDFNNVKPLDIEFINDPSIYAVVGFSPDVSIYNERGLVLVSPINLRKSSESAKYVFSAAPNPNVLSDLLASYIVKEAGISNIAICSDSTFPRSKEIVEQYTDSIRNYGGKVTSTFCDLGAPDFRASAFLSQAISDGVEGLLLVPRPDKINLNSAVLDVARENQGRLPLFGFQGMYTEKTLKFGKADVKGMVLAVPWHRDAIPDNPFSKKAAQLWGGEVSPRTATAYDALQVVIAGLKEGYSRKGLQKALSNPNFSASGATGKIQFSPTGDRKGGVFLVKVQPCDPTKPCSSTGYDFALVQQ